MNTQNNNSHYIHTNALINETSPYLLQHAHNPVDWVTWSDNTLEAAVSDDQLLIISIGYSACHWCHVMEHESFEDESVAELMNNNFLNIKIDREERPDIDHIYMQAIQLITGQGGWPLNVIALPDGRPIYACTYLPKQNWSDLLNNILAIRKNHPHKILEQAEAVTQGLQSNNLALNPQSTEINEELLDKAFQQWQKRLDNKWGGTEGQPKFPMPSSFNFLLEHAEIKQNKQAQTAFDLTLEKMAQGGLFDHIGGGFARYSTDKYWFAPHFEKMLYDNGQLMSLYATAYIQNNNILYKNTVNKTAQFLKDEMLDSSGLFYSAIDADSEGEEGKFYVWKSDELKTILGDDYAIFADFYAIKERGNWENNTNILFNTISTESIGKKYKLEPEEVLIEIYELNKKLLSERNKRIRPGTDDKMITSWNALAIKGFADAYCAFDQPEYLEIAETAYNAVKKHLLKKDNSLYRTYKNNHAKINAFLDDYALLIQASLALYKVTFSYDYITNAINWTDYCLQYFYDKESLMFNYTSSVDKPLLTKKQEIYDNVIPSSNSVMAHNLYTLGRITSNNTYIRIAKQMLCNIEGSLIQNNEYMGNWLSLYLKFASDQKEIAITGKNINALRKNVFHFYLPTTILVGGSDEIPLLKGKNKSEDNYYVCINSSCKMPVTNTEDMIRLLNKK